MVNVVTITRSLENNLTAASLTRENFFHTFKMELVFSGLVRLRPKPWLAGSDTHTPADILVAV